jgi:hypothetical protein
MATHKRAPKRATVYFDPGLHKALRLKAAETEQSLSELVNAAVRQALAEDNEDLTAFDERQRAESLLRRRPQRPEAAWQAIVC